MEKLRSDARSVFFLFPPAPHPPPPPGTLRLFKGGAPRRPLSAERHAAGAPATAAGVSGGLPHTSTMTVPEIAPTDAPLWLFGYGSLLFKPPLHHLPISKDFRRFDGHVQGFIRRFWQSSYDNRGTPEYKGRVVTIVPARDVAATPAFHASVREHELAHLPPAAAAAVLADADRLHAELAVGGCVYYVPPQHARAARAYLDFREKDGYAAEEVVFHVSAPADADAGEDVDEILAGLPRDAAGRRLIRCVVYVGSPANASFVGPEHVDTTAARIHKAVGPSGPNIEYLLLLQREDPADTYLQTLKERVELLAAAGGAAAEAL